MDIKRSDFTGRFHRIVQLGNTVYLAGVTARDGDGDVAAQTADVLLQIEELLAKAGASKQGIVTANIWLADIADFAAMNSAWDQWVDKEHAPVRATVESKLARPDLKVEIQVTAISRQTASNVSVARNNWRCTSLGERAVQQNQSWARQSRVRPLARADVVLLGQPAIQPPSTIRLMPVT